MSILNHNELILKLNKKKTTHPNIISFWINLLNQKKKLIRNVLKIY